MAAKIVLTATGTQVVSVAQTPAGQASAAIDANFGVVGQQIAAVVEAVNTNADGLDALAARVDSAEAQLTAHDAQFAAIAAAAAGGGSAASQPQPAPAPVPAPVLAAPVAPVATPAAAPVAPVVHNNGTDPVPWIVGGIAFVLMVILFALIAGITHTFLWWWVLVTVLMTVCGVLVGFAVSRSTRAADTSTTAA